jgi:hypothetical protein
VVKFENEIGTIFRSFYTPSIESRPMLQCHVLV